MSDKVAIIILHWKHTQDTVACLRSLKSCTYDNFNVILLLNGTSYEDKITLRNLFDQWHKLTIIENEDNVGFAEGNNIAIRHALDKYNPDYILCLNNDTEAEPNFIQEAVNKATEGYDLIQILMYDLNNRKQIDKAGIKLTKSGLTFDIKTLADPAPLFCPSAGAALYSVKMLKDIAWERQVSSGFQASMVKDYFDKDYFSYAEDFDLGFRALLKGYKPALAFKSVVYHKGSASTSVMSDLAVYHTYRNLIFTYLKCYPTSWLIKYLVFIKIGYWAVFIKSFTRKQARIFARACIDGWKYRKRMLKKRKTIQTQAKIKSRELKKYISKRFFR